MPSVTSPYRLRRLLLIGALIAVGPILGACSAEGTTQEDIDWIFSIGEEWARANQVIDDSGNINWTRAVQKVFGFPSGDAQVDAALDAGPIVAELEELERQVREAAQLGDLAKIQAAIDAREKDWGFVEVKAALLLAQDNIPGAEIAFEESEALVRNQISKGGDCELLARNMFTHRISALELQLGLQPNDQLSSKAAETQAQLDALAADQSIAFCQ